MLRDKLQLGRASYQQNVGAIFAYLFHRISWKECQTYLGDKKTGKHVQQVLSQDGYILRDCKLFAHNHWVGEREGWRVSPRDFGVTSKDATLLRRVNLKHVPTKYEAYMPAELERHIQEAVYGSDISTYMGKFISKKMTFLINSYGVPRDDIEGQLQAAAIKGLYKQYPFFESELHLRNTAKTIVKNEGQTLINFHTRASRNRLQKTTEGALEQKIMTLDSVFDVEAPTTVHDEIRDSIETLVSLSTRMNPKVQRFLMIAAGQYDEEFSKFLEVDNRDAVEEMAYSRYLSKVQRFLGVSEQQVQKLFERLRPHLE